MGRLGQNPELRYTQSQQGVLSIRMATTESYFDKNTNQRKEETEWHSVVIWGKRAEALNKILSKGSRICVEGKLKTRSWEKDGSKRYATEIVANNVILLGGKGEGTAAHGGAPESRAPGESYGGYGGEPDDSDIPF